ncbi:MAG: response regulator [Thermodesulfobacteriota bacterium]
MTKQEKSSPDPLDAGTHAAGNRKVLIVDDDAFFLEVLYDIVSKAGYEIVGVAENGEDGVNKARLLNPDIVMLDIIMPVKNGLVAAKEIKASHPLIKIVMCTSLKDAMFVKEADACGVSAYIKKPFSEADVLTALKGLDF